MNKKSQTQWKLVSLILGIILLMILLTGIANYSGILEDQLEKLKDTFSLF